MSKHSRASRLIGAAALLISLAACDNATPPTQPSAPPPPAPPPAPPPQPAGVTVSGVLLEFTATGESRPVPNLRLKVRTGGPFDTAAGGVQLADAVTDSRGHYTIADVSAQMLFFQTAFKPGYSLVKREIVGGFESEVNLELSRR